MGRYLRVNVVEPTKVVITGASGQIGSNLIRWLEQQGPEKYQAIGIDKNSFPWWDLSQSAVVKDFYRGDIAESSFDLSPLMEWADVVIHLAAYAKVHELVEYPDRAVSNFMSIYRVAEACRRHNTPVVFASSREVYGNKPEFEVRSVREDDAHIQAQESPYSATKLAGEAMLHACHKSYDLPFVIVRFSNVYGRYDNDLERMERVIPLFAKRISKGEPIEVFGKNKTLDFTYIDDAIDGLTRAMRALLANHKRHGTVVGATFNLAYGRGSTLWDLVNLLSLSIGKEPVVTFTDPLRGEVTYYIADISKAKLQLGYQPKTPLSAGVISTVEWYKSVGFISL